MHLVWEQELLELSGDIDGPLRDVKVTDDESELNWSKISVDLLLRVD